MWIQLDESILSTVLNKSELTRVTSDRASCEVDPVPGILSDVATMIRGRIRSGGRSEVQGDALSIPDELAYVAGALVRQRILTRLSLSITDDRKREYEDAMTTLREISSGEYVIAATAAEKTSKPIYKGRKRKWGYNPDGSIM